jgi:RNA polymerase subunit RPABC4/transcription elongation factor Spt4
MLAAIKGLVTAQFVRAQANDVALAAFPSYSDVVGLANNLATYWAAVSNGSIQLAVNVYPRIVALPLNAADLVPMSRAAIGDAIIEAASPEADLSGMDIFVGLVNTPCGGGDQGNQVVTGFYQELGQRHWMWCSKCQSLAFWDQSRPPGSCPAGERHDHSSSSRYVARQQSAGETGWRWCRGCECLARPSGQLAPCAAGLGGHDFSASGDYVVATDPTPTTQDKFSRCSRCTVLVYTGNSPGPCAAGGVHTPVGSYYVGLDQFPTLAFMAHETGHALGLDHSFNDSPKPLDAGNDSRPGAYGDLWDIMSYQKTDSYHSPQLGDAGPCLAAPTLFKTGWIGKDRVWFNTNVASAQIELVSTSETIPDGYLCAIVGVPDLGRVYSFEYRTPVEWDRGIPGPGVLIREHLSARETPSLALFAQNGWKSCQKCGGLAFQGNRACAKGDAHASDGTALVVPSGTGPYLMPSQPGWQWCSRCQALVQEESGPGTCAAGGSHDTGDSGEYWALLAENDDQESSLRWCRNCKAMVVSDPGGGHCPMGGRHDISASSRYLMANEQPLLLLTPSQGQWTACTNCRSVFFDGTGVCPAGGAHDGRGSADYFLVPDIDWSPGQHSWRWCAKCYCLAFLDPGRGPGICAAGGLHDHGSSGNYSVEFTAPYPPSIPPLAIEQAEQSGWQWCRRCEMLGLQNGQTRCPAGGAHDFSQSGVYRLPWEVCGVGDQGHLQQSRSWGVGDQFVSSQTEINGKLVVDIVEFKTQPSRATVKVSFTPPISVLRHNVPRL